MSSAVPPGVPVPPADYKEFLNSILWYIQITDTVLHFSKSTTSDVLTPTTGKAIMVTGFLFYADADIVAELRFKTSGNVIGALPTKGVVGMNLIILKKPQGAVDEVIEIYLSGAGNVKGWLTYEEV